MIINDAGEYTLKYTATDACGNSTVVERGLTVEAPPTYRTVLYTDGTFIINESSMDEEANIAAHGQPTNVYDPFDPNGETATSRYEFAGYPGRPWNAQSSSINSVEIGSNIQPTSTAYWFNGFATCTNIDMTNLDTSHVINMAQMFGGCYALESIDMSNFNTNVVVDMSSMFTNCRNITTIDVSGFNTSNVTNMSGMFNSCYKLVSLDLSNFNTSNVTNMESMFQETNAIQNIDLSGFDTSKVTTMRRMFYECDNLTTVDISGFDVSLVSDMREMFSYVETLTTIYASSLFDALNVSSSTNMFRSTRSLVGGAGTVWNSSYTDKTYAHIDGGTSNPGYFTAKS